MSEEDRPPAIRITDSPDSEASRIRTVNFDTAVEVTRSARTKLSDIDAKRSNVLAPPHATRSWWRDPLGSVATQVVAGVVAGLLLIGLSAYFGLSN